MGLTLPGVLGRVFSATAQLFQSAKVSGDAQDSLRIYSDGAIYSSDGTELLDGTQSYARPTWYVKRRSGQIGLVIRGTNAGGLMNVLEVQDYLGAPIASVGEAGNAFWGNDWISTNYGVFYPKACAFSIYGGMLLSGQAIYMHSGPPGNILSFVDSVVEAYDGSRAGSMGSWTTLSNCTAAADQVTYTGASSPANPTGYRGIHKITSSAAGSLSWSIPGASAYSINPGSRIDATMAVRGSVARSNTLSLMWYTSAGAAASTPQTDGTAVTSTTTGWTFIKVSGLPPSGASKVGLKVTVAGAAAANEIHYGTAAGIWSGLVPGDLTSWAPPYVFNQAGTGADIGSMYFRTDGYKNPTQRLYSCVTAGTPVVQRWTNDITPYASPSRVNVYGHMASTAGFASSASGNTPVDWLMHEVLAGMMRIDEEDMRSTQVAGAKLTIDGFALGGHSSMMQWMRKTQSRGKPYVSKDGVTVLCYGLYDLAFVTAAQGSAVMSQLNGSGSTSSNGTIVNTLRDMICRARASVIFEVPAAAAAPWTTTTMGAATGGVDYASGATRPGASDGFFRQMSTITTHTFTFTLPADIQNGSEIDFSFIGVNGTAGGTITWTGTAASTGGLFTSGITTQITNVAANPASGTGRGRFVKRFTGLMASHAGQTIIGTLTQVDASGNVNIDCAYLTGPRPSMVVVCGQYRLVNAAAYVTLGNATVATGYWNVNAGATGDTDITTLNTDLAALAAEFGSEVVYADLDNALLKAADYFASNGVDLNEDGHMVVAQVVSRAIADGMSLIDPRQTVMDRHDKRAQPICTWIHPEGATGAITVATNTKRWQADDHYVITAVRGVLGTAGSTTTTVDLLRGVGAGTPATIYTTTGNRLTFASTETVKAAAAPPDITYVAPGDTLVTQITAAGTSAANLAVTVFAKKISPP